MYMCVCFVVCVCVQVGNRELVLSQVEPIHTVYVFNCRDCVLQVRGGVGGVSGGVGGCGWGLS